MKIRVSRVRAPPEAPNKIEVDMKEQVAKKVAELFKDGRTPLEHYGIDGDKISEVEKRHPEVAKQIPLSKRIMHG